MIYCVWCGREFSKSFLFYNNHKTIIPYQPTNKYDILFQNSYECTFCNPSFPLNVCDNEKKGQFTIINIGSYLGNNNNIEESNNRFYLYPVDYCVVRRYKSYLYKTTTYIKCEILEVDENYLQVPYSPGKKDVLLFRITYADDPDNPIEVLNNLYKVSSVLKERYRSTSVLTGHTLFGLDSLYTQYLIRIHVSNDERNGPSLIDIFNSYSNRNNV